MVLLSEEQKNIIESARNNNILVDCVVGSGKTTTILEIAKDQIDKKFLLLVYNNCATLSILFSSRKR